MSVLLKINKSYHRISAVYRLVFRGYFLNGGAFFYSIFYPFLLLLFLGLLKLGNTNNAESIKAVLSGLMVLTVVDAGLFALNTRLQEWKEESTIIKSIGAIGVKKGEFLFSFGLFYMLIMTIEASWLISLAFILQRATGSIAVDNIKPIFIITGFIIGAFFSMTIGICLGVMIHDENTAILIAILITFPISFVSGQLLPLSIIENTKTLNVISEIFPQRYMVIFMYHGWGVANDLWNLKAILLGTVYPIVFGIIAMILSIRLFKWNTG